MRKANAAVGLPYILVKSRERPDGQPKRILIPRSIAALQKSAFKALKLEKPIMTIYDSNGGIVTDISHVLPGTTLIMSDIAAKPQIPAAKPKTPRRKQSRLPESSRTRRVFGNITLTLAKNQHSDTDDADFEESQESAPPPPPQPSAPAPPPPPPQQDIREEEEYVFEEEEEEEEQDTEEEPQGLEETDDEASIEDELTEDHADIVEEEEVLEEEQEFEVEKLFKEVLPDHDFGDVLHNAAKELPGAYLDFLDRALAIESKHRAHWLNAMNQIAEACNYKVDKSRLLSYETLKANAVEQIQKHFRASSCGYMQRMGMAITGPVGSGKTAFFSVMLEQELLALAASDLWKTTFVVILNGEDFSACSDSKTLFLTMVKATIPLLIAQTPALIPHETLIRKFLEKIVDTEYIPLLPKRFKESPETRKVADACLAIAQQLIVSKNENSGDTFAARALMLPVMFAKELGYRNIMFYVDNIDMLNVIMSDENANGLFLDDAIKAMLTSGDFIVSYKRRSDFQGLASQWSDESVDLDLMLEYLSVLDLGGEVEYQNMEIIVQMGHESVKINTSHFGSAPGFVERWLVINRIFDKMDECDKDSEEYEDYLAAALGEVQNVMLMIFEADDEIGDVDDVRRKEISSR